MKKVTCLVLERDLDRLTLGLGRLGAIHLTPPAREAGAAVLARPDLRHEFERLAALERRVGRLATLLRVPPETEPPATLSELPAADEISRILDLLEPEMDRVVERRQTLGNEDETLRTIVSQVESFVGTSLDLSSVDQLSFVHFAIGSLPPEGLDPVRREAGDRVILVPFRQTKDARWVLAVTTKRGRFALEAALAKHGFRADDVGPMKETGFCGKPSEVLDRARRRLDEIAAKDRSLGERLETLARENTELLHRTLRQVGVLQKIAQAHENFGRTQTTCVISGWVPAGMMETFVTKTLELTDSRVVIERLDPDELPAREEPPTVLRHSWLVRPFALLVTGYGVPRYREIEPTLIVAVSYFLMYGMMFGDVGQGAVLVVIGLALRWLARREFEKDFGMLLALCGVSAIIFGFIYGSVFGKEGVIEPLWLSPVGEKVGLLLAVSVTAGIAFISLGVIFNVFNQVRVGNWVGATCDRFGVAGLVFYWGVLGLLLKYFVTGTINAGVAALIIAVPLLVLMFKEPVRFALRRARSNGTAHGGEPDEAAGHEGPGNFFEAAVEGLMEVFEAPLLFTSNTISFMRLGAYAMGHAGLCVVIFSLAKALSSLAGGTVWAVLMIVVGNILVIGLEGLVVAVQALRLEYYEFFSKFYSGDGWAYRPFDLKGEES